MKKIARLPTPSMSLFKIREPVKGKIFQFTPRKWQIQWVPFMGNKDHQILNIYFASFGICIEIKWRLLMLNKKRGVKEIAVELSKYLPNNNMTWEMAKHLSKLEKRSWYITIV